MTISFVISVCLSFRPPTWNNSPLTRSIFLNIDIWGFFENLSKKLQVSLKSSKNDGYFTWDLCTFMIISRWILRVRNVSGKNVVEKTKAQIMCSVTSLRKSCRLLYNVEKYYRAGQATDGDIIRRIRNLFLLNKFNRIHPVVLYQ